MINASRSALNAAIVASVDYKFCLRSIRHCVKEIAKATHGDVMMSKRCTKCSLIALGRMTSADICLGSPYAASLRCMKGGHVKVGMSAK